MNEYRGITYPKFLRGKIVHWLWKRFMCGRNRHLFDEVWSLDDHYLYCDACGLEVHIKAFKFYAGRYTIGYKSKCTHGK